LLPVVVLLLASVLLDLLWFLLLNAVSGASLIACARTALGSRHALDIGMRLRRVVISTHGVAGLQECLAAVMVVVSSQGSMFPLTTIDPASNFQMVNINKCWLH
jgi:ABC-type uncharacterized transport system permease subunit